MAPSQHGDMGAGHGTGPGEGAGEKVGAGAGARAGAREVWSGAGAGAGVGAGAAGAAAAAAAGLFVRPGLGDLRVHSPGSTDLTLVCRDGQLQVCTHLYSSLGVTIKKKTEI